MDLLLPLSMRDGAPFISAKSREQEVHQPIPGFFAR